MLGPGIPHERFFISEFEEQKQNYVYITGAAAEMQSEKEHSGNKECGIYEVENNGKRQENQAENYERSSRREKSCFSVYVNMGHAAERTAPAESERKLFPGHNFVDGAVQKLVKNYVYEHSKKEHKRNK